MSDIFVCDGCGMAVTENDTCDCQMVEVKANELADLRKRAAAPEINDEAVERLAEWLRDHFASVSHVRSKPLARAALRAARGDTDRETVEAALKGEL